MSSYADKRENLLLSYYQRCKERGKEAFASTPSGWIVSEMKRRLRRDDSNFLVFAEPDISYFEILSALLVNRAAVF